ncbi:alkaline phosphatase D family protein [Alteromonas oceanisediminis]|uniref:alkaline phosphatase D family protein n=1 Tax=Alteromonas oceanisediminis TaxID=2836180 RepID=UPI001BD9A2A4|nr:alkaline phosphatase D family protein [Alteromonas oceanisediminis]MBT0585180.1 alkaline phosphatase D family protein [Alteromonas oceanisediminis]
MKHLMRVKHASNKNEALDNGRRDALGTLIKGSIFASFVSSPLAFTVERPYPYPPAVKFEHGVASGDPSEDGIVIWTRVSPINEKEATSRNIDVSWQLSIDRQFENPVSQGIYRTSKANDFCVKVLVEKLEAGQTYFYKFQVGAVESPIGTTKTLPTGSLEKLRVAVVSCANFPFGYFNVYDHISRRLDIDFVLHLGDYLYEYGTAEGELGAKEGNRLNRPHIPANETITLSDYRQRHSQYKKELASQAVHAAHPFILIWDDHEFANNAYKDGAQNHSPETEGDWKKRKESALKAYFEWMPRREPKHNNDSVKAWKTYEFGDLASFICLETRLAVRDNEVLYQDGFSDRESFFQNTLGDESRQYIGPKQQDFVADALLKSRQRDKPWQILVNQCTMARLHMPDLSPYLSESIIDELEIALHPAPREHIVQYLSMTKFDLPFNLDAWDGYPHERELLYNAIQKTDAKVLVLTGDTHAFMTNTLYDNKGQRRGIELGTSSITSESYIMEIFKAVGIDFPTMATEINREIDYYNAFARGYIDLTLSKEKAIANYISVSTIEDEEYQTNSERKLRIRDSLEGLVYEVM